MDLETLAIKYQTLGENEVRASLVMVGAQADQTATVVEQSAGRMGAATDGLGATMEKLSHRFERSGVLIAFAVENMLNGQQTGIQRALHSIALLGFAFGPVAGAIATGAALALEEIKNFVEKAEKEVKDFQKTMGDAVNAGDTAKLMKVREDLIVGTPFDPKTGEMVGRSVEAIGNFKNGLNDLYATWQHLKEQRDAADKTLGGASIVRDLDAKIADAAKQYQIKKQMLEDVDKDLELAETRRSRAARQEQQPKMTITGESDKGKAEKALQAKKAQYEQEVEAAKDNYAKVQALDAAYLESVIKQYKRGSAEYYEQLKQMEAHQKEHLAKLGTDGEAALRRTLDNYKREAESTRANYELQSKLAEDSQGSTEQKYARIEALDQQYLQFIVEMYDQDSTEYVEQLRAMEEHHKAHLDAKQKDEEDYARNIKAINDMMQGWTDESQRQSKEKALKVATEVGTGIEQIAKAAFAKGATIGSVAQQFEDMILKTLGSVLVKQGEAYIAQSSIMLALAPLLSNPFTAGGAALGIGLALVALGSLLGGIASGGGGGGGGGGPTGAPAPVNFTSSIGLGPNGAVSASGLSPVTPLNVTVIGPNDPTAQRQLLELMTNAQRR